MLAGGTDSDVRFRDTMSFQELQSKAAEIREKHPDRIPMIFERVLKSDVPLSDKKKFLVPKDLTMGQVAYMLRRRIQLPADKAIFIYVNRELASSNALISDLDRQHCDPTGFLFFEYSGESTFGGTDMAATIDLDHLNQILQTTEQILIPAPLLWFNGTKPVQPPPMNTTPNLDAVLIPPVEKRRHTINCSSTLNGFSWTSFFDTERRLRSFTD